MRRSPRTAPSSQMRSPRAIGPTKRVATTSGRARSHHSHPGDGRRVTEELPVDAYLLRVKPSVLPRAPDRQWHRWPRAAPRPIRSSSTRLARRKCSGSSAPPFGPFARLSVAEPETRPAPDELRSCWPLVRSRPLLAGNACACSSPSGTAETRPERSSRGVSQGRQISQAVFSIGSTAGQLPVITVLVRVARNWAKRPPPLVWRWSAITRPSIVG